MLYLVEHAPSGYHTNRTNLIYLNKTLKTETTFNNHTPKWAIDLACGCAFLIIVLTDDRLLSDDVRPHWGI